MRSSPDYDTIPAGGHRPTLYDHHLSSREPFWARVESQPAPTGLDANVHSGLEVCIGLRGEAEISYGDFRLPVLPGQVTLTAMWEPHGWRALAPGTEHFVIVFLPDFLGENPPDDLPWLSMFAAPPDCRPRATEQQLREHLIAIGRRLKMEMTERAPGWESIVRLYILLVLASLRRQWQRPAGIGDGHGPHATSIARIAPALQLFHTAPSGQVSVAEAAEACSLSRSQFDAVFKQTMGVTFGRFRARTRLSLAAQLLLTTDLTIAAVAEQAAFVDSSHLHRAFFRHYRCTPAQYRQNGRAPAP
jgi:AraC-like DNA-binding protein